MMFMTSSSRITQIVVNMMIFITSAHAAGGRFQVVGKYYPGSDVPQDMFVGPEWDPVTKEYFPNTGKEHFITEFIQQATEKGFNPNSPVRGRQKVIESVHHTYDLEFDGDHYLNLSYAVPTSGCIEKLGCIFGKRKDPVLIMTLTEGCMPEGTCSCCTRYKQFEALQRCGLTLRDLLERLLDRDRTVWQYQDYQVCSCCWGCSKSNCIKLCKIVKDITDESAQTDHNVVAVSRSFEPGNDRRKRRARHSNPTAQASQRSQPDTSDTAHTEPESNHETEFEEGAGQNDRQTWTEWSRQQFGPWSIL